MITIAVGIAAFEFGFIVGAFIIAYFGGSV